MYLTRLPFFIVLLFIAGCGAGANIPPGSITTSYVDSTYGNDLNDGGSQSSAFRTITHAIAEGATRIHLSTGTYDAVSGEAFPIMISSNVLLFSETDSSNIPNVIVRGAGSYTSPSLGVTKQVAFVLDGNNSTIQSIIVEGLGGIGVWNETGNAVVKTCVIRDSDTGIVSGGNSTLQIIDSKIQNNVGAGLDALNSATPSLTKTTITGNSIGVLVSDSAKPTFKEQSNELRSNTFCDLRHLGSAALTAQGVTWDNDQFLFAATSICSGGENIANEGIGSVSYQPIPQAGVPVFVGTFPLILNSPSRGALSSANQPSFSWIPSGSTLTILTVWNRPPSFANGVLGDKSTIQWLWHSGLGTGVPGSVTFNDGKSIPTGDLNNLATPQPLQRGRSYYWAVWEWDEGALNIRASSELGYFTVLN